MAVNDFENPEKVKIKTGMIKNAASKFSYSFPINLLSLKKREDMLLLK